MFNLFIKQQLSNLSKIIYTIVDGICLGSGVDVKEENKDRNTLSVSSRYLSLFPNFIIGTYFP